MKTKIYALCEVDGRVRYIGKTAGTLRHRLGEHLSESRSLVSKKNYRTNWMRSLLRSGIFPIIMLVGSVDGDGKKEEIAWISYGFGEGWKLTNLTKGGDGTVGYKHTDEDKKRNGLLKKGVPLSAIAKERISRALTGKIVSDNTKRLLSIAQIGMQYSDASKKKMSESHKGRVASAETKLKMSASQTGRHHTDKTKKKLAAINKGKHHSAETKTKLSLWHTGRRLNAVTKRKMSEAQIKRQNLLRELKKGEAI